MLMFDGRRLEINTNKRMNFLKLTNSEKTRVILQNL